MIAGFLLFFFSVPAAYFVAAKFLAASSTEAVVVTVFVGLGMMVAAGLNLGAEEGRHFRRVLRPQIEDFMDLHGLGRDEFLLAARGALKESSTLLKHLDDLYGRP